MDPLTIGLLTAGGGALFNKLLSSDFGSGTPEKHERVSTLGKEQIPLYNQLLKAGNKPGAGGAFGQSADYYRDLLSNNPEDLEAFSKPEMRRFREQIIPNIAEEFAGMGSGALSSSGFRNSAVNAGTDLSERLGALRANLRQSGAQGLQNIGQLGLGNFTQDVMTQPGTNSFLSGLGPGVGSALTGVASNWLQSGIGGTQQPQQGPHYNFPSPNRSNAGTTNPYGGNSVSQGGYKLPDFNPSMGR